MNAIEQHAEWRRWFARALKKGRPGELSVLALEAPTRALEIEARRAAEFAAAEMQAAAAHRRPRHVLLFSGHMIDRPHRPQPRFPAAKETIAAAALAHQLDALNVGAQDLGICGGACGGDLLFAEACMQRGLRLEIYLPFAVETFAETSINFAGTHWREKFCAVTEHERTRLRLMPEELGPTPAGGDPYSRVNLWMLYTAQAWGVERTQFICLWNGEAGDGPGGTKHLIDAVLEQQGRVHLIDTNKLW